MGHLLVALLGAFSNRYRGGIFGKAKGQFLEKALGDGIVFKVVNRLLDGKIVNAFIWAIYCSYLFTGELVEYQTYALAAGAGIMFVYSFIIMLRYSAPSWGEYIGAAKGTNTDDFEGADYINDLIEPLKHKPVLWGVAGLSIRCGEWGLMLGAPLITFLGFWAFGPMIVGLLAGPTVWLLSKIEAVGALPKIKYLDSVWEWFEAILGIWFFLVVYVGAKANGL